MNASYNYTMHQKEPLCQSYDPFREHPAIYSKLFLPGKIHCSLRPFHIANDLPLINHWLNFQFTKKKQPVRDIFQYTEDYYTTLLATPNSQPLMGTIDHQPAFQADVYQALLGPDTLLNTISFNEGDFIMQLMMSPQTLQNLSPSLYCLVACLDCFFKYPEINRLVWMTNAGERNCRFIAGIAELEEINCPDNHQSYYIISKQRFREIQFDLPVYPEEQPIAIDY
jgi:hypothetical protein